MKIVAYNAVANYDAACAELLALEPDDPRAAKLRDELEQMRRLDLDGVLEYRGIDAMAAQLEAQHRMIGNVKIVIDRR